MKNTVICFTIISLLTTSLILASCSTTTTPSTTTTTQIKATSSPSSTISAVTTAKVSTTTATQTNWWDKFGKPVYGGTINYRTSATSPTWDVNTFVGAEWQFYFENLTIGDWTLDRNTFNFKGSYTPDQYLQNLMIESWEQTDPLTLTFHIRKGITWQKKAPVNGREFTAYDVEFHLDRMMGTGHGFTAPNPVYVNRIATWEKVTAVDDYTFTLKLKQLSAEGVSGFLSGGGKFEAPEWVDQGDTQNWKNAVGTGPWMLSDYVDGNSISFAANPNYWWHDERYPNNKIPYADELRVLIIEDISTAEAALRTGKIDIIGGEGAVGLTLEQTNKLTETNSALISIKMPKPASALMFRVDTKPFTDINVRKAMQMAIDSKTIAKNFYSGQVEGTPAGIIHPDMTGFAYAYTEWPQSLKDEYSYNPAKAKQLLTEAGYPNGFDTNVITPSVNDTNLLQIFKSYYHEVGIEMDISVMDFGAFHALASAGKHDQMVFWFISTGQVNVTDFVSTNKSQNFGKINDPVYENLAAGVKSAKDATGYMKAVYEADKYFLSQHWVVSVGPTVSFTVLSPSLQGYSGEDLKSKVGPIFARCWKSK